MCHNRIMSAIIAIKCVNGVAIGSDSRITRYENGRFSYEKEGKKIFSGEDYLIGFYNLFSVRVKNYNLGTEILETLDLDEVLEDSKNFNIFLNNFMNKVNLSLNTEPYEFVLAKKENGTFKLYSGAFTNGTMHLNSHSDFFMNNFDFGFNDTFRIEKKLDVLKAKEVIKKIITTNKFLQSNLLNYSNVGGEVIVKVLK